MDLYPHKNIFEFIWRGAGLCVPARSEPRTTTCSADRQRGLCPSFVRLALFAYFCWKVSTGGVRGFGILCFEASLWFVFPSFTACIAGRCVYYDALKSRGKCGFFRSCGWAAFFSIKLTKVRERVFPLYYGINNQHKHSGRSHYGSHVRRNPQEP